MKKRKKTQNELIIYQAKNGAIEFRGDFCRDTIWATQKQIATVFGVQRPAVTKHINNIFKDQELDQKSVCSEMEHTAEDGKKYKTKFYNLDIILAVGYRTNSAKAIEFRKWSTGILKKHIIEGYTINRKIVGENYDKFIKAVNDVEKLLPAGNKVDAKDILELIKSFAGTWVSLESYDEEKFPQRGFTKRDVEVHADDLYDAVEKLKRDLMKKKQATDLFAQEKKQRSLEGILGNVMQAVFGKDVYGSIEEKAVHLLYFVVKNHPFVDGNKRTGAFAFIWFLNKSRIPFREKITPEALTAITLLVAESKPKDKDRVIGLIFLLLKK